MNTPIPLTDLEAAINYWRQQHPSLGEEMRLCPQASALANHYAMMIVQHQTAIDEQALAPLAQDAFRAWQQSSSTA